MTGLVILGTDTDAGKTAFSLVWLHAFGDRFDVWKPVETGDSDAATIQLLAPHVRVHPPLARFTDPVAPPLAARREGRRCPTALELIDAFPPTDRPLLIETFGSPLSPLNESELQIAFVQRLAFPCVMVASSRVGAVGRVLQSLSALATHGIRPPAVVLLGAHDEYAESEIAKHAPTTRVFSLPFPEEWTIEAFRSIADTHRDRLAALLNSPPPLPRDWLDADRRHVWHPYTSLQPAIDPLPVVAAREEFLHLADGRQLIDAVSSWWTILHGHRFPPLIAALMEAAHTLDHVIFAGVTHPPAVQLAERLLRTMPWTGGRVFYSDNGSTAVEVALKMAYQFWCHRHEPQRTLFVSFEHAYHGDTFGAMSVGRDRLFSERLSHSCSMWNIFH